MNSIYRSIMDSEKNPLRSLPHAQRFQIMVYLSIMWTTIFCLGTGAWLWYGELVVAHLLVAAGFLVTAWTFRSAPKVSTYRDYPREDGTARYDDVWSA